jgi:bifunctional UDP-N-acetylglucosamine pyrophosphorylase/glucosamine-1-phosphate N-acetyltransferase
VTGYGADAVEDSIMDPKPIFARQMPQLGTGHAVQQALPHLSRHGMTIILNGDTPLIKHQTIEKMISTCAGCGMLLLTARLDDPTGYGRIMRNSRGAIIGIVEDKDATEEQKQVNEVYTGMMAVSTFHLRRWLGKLSNDNAQQEYYLTDIVGMAVVNGTPVHSVLADSSEEVLGVNTPEQLKILEEYLK